MRQTFEELLLFRCQQLLFKRKGSLAAALSHSDAELFTGVIDG
jgi:hypothetical protein